MSLSLSNISVPRLIFLYVSLLDVKIMFINILFSLKFYSSQQHVILSCISPVHNLRQYGFVTSPNAFSQININSCSFPFSLE